MDKKLSAAQIKMLNNIAIKAPAAYPENTAKSLRNRGLINIPLFRYDGVGYTLTSSGEALLRVLNNPLLNPPQITTKSTVPNILDAGLTGDIMRHNQIAFKR